MPNEEIKLKPCPFCGGEAKALLGYILYLDVCGKLNLPKKGSKSA